MDVAKRTYVLPSDVLQRFEKVIAPGKRSAKVAEILEEWIHEREQEALRQDIIEGCKDMWEVYLKTAHDWEPLDREVDSLLEH
jgi:metal-responsive CopG/Arc/MetJ family transcriptional regulator